jgi:hypothetical protein
MKFSVIVILLSLYAGNHMEREVYYKYLKLGGELNSEIDSFLEQEKSMPYFSNDFFVIASFTSRKNGIILLHIEGGTQKIDELYTKNILGVASSYGHWIYIYKDTCQVSDDLVEVTDSIISDKIYQRHVEDSVSDKMITLDIIEDDTYNYWDYLVFGDSLKKL